MKIVVGLEGICDVNVEILIPPNVKKDLPK